MSSTATEVGKIIGNIINKQVTTDENLAAQEVDSQVVIVNQEQFRLSGTLSIVKRAYATDSFILDHPVYGELDSSTLKIDGGYDTGSFDRIYSKTFN